MPAHPVPVTAMNILAQLGNIGFIYVLMLIILIVWFFLLLLRVRPLSEHIAYLAATVYPFFLGIFGSTSYALYRLLTLGNSGLANPSSLASEYTIMSRLLFYGSLLTCLFFPLGILVLLIRKPK